MPNPDGTQVDDLIATIRGQAERESDSKARADLLAAAEKVRKSAELFRETDEKIEKALENSRRLKEQFDRDRRIPGWLAALIIVGFVLFMLYSAWKQVH